MTDVDVTFVDELLERLGRGRDQTLPLLQAIQAKLGYLPPEALERLSRLSEITPADIAGVSTFYSQFRHRPIGKHLISLCHGTACHVKGAERLWDAFRKELGLEGDADTDARGLFTLEKVACLGCCTLAPAAQIDTVTYGHLSPDLVPRVLRDFLDYHERQRAAHPPAVTADAASEVRIGLGSCCVARGSAQVQQALEKAIRDNRLGVSIRRVGCVGMCHQTPLVEIVTGGKSVALYARVQSDDAEKILLRHFRRPMSLGALGRRVSAAFSSAVDAFTRPGDEGLDRHLIEKREGPVAGFLSPQIHIATEFCGEIDPLDLDEYLRRGGFASLEKARAMAPDAVIAEVAASGLSGRGGAGYPTHLKWSAVRAAAGETKYAICNGDEGDPGAFMDRMLLESYPFRVLEGLCIAAGAVGASEAVFYIRAEYPLAVQRVTEAIGLCKARGLLGGLEVRVFQGAGAFVCGEETALIASIEGRRGMPRLRPPYPAQQGLWGKPTLVNNVETLAMVPWIVRNGGAALAKIGTDGSKGTKVFALAGKTARGGLVEVPMGISLRRIVEEIGGGIAGDRAFKAVQIGGPSGGCLSSAQADTPVDYRALVASGAIMGSGGLVVLDETDCMVDIARYFLQFTQSQSCGRCTFCRIGTRRMLDILDRLAEGRAVAADLDELEQLALAVKRTSLCGLGKTAPNPVLSTLHHFRAEYEAHLAGRCPAGKCRALVHYRITDRCIGCTLCAQRCPADAIAMRPYQQHEVDDVKCTRCGTCLAVCPHQAVKVE